MHIYTLIKHNYANMEAYLSVKKSVWR